MIRALGYYTDGCRDVDVDPLAGQQLDATSAHYFVELVDRARSTSPRDFVWLGLHDPDADELDRTFVADFARRGRLTTPNPHAPRDDGVSIHVGGWVIPARQGLGA